MPTRLVQRPQFGGLIQRKFGKIEMWKSESAFPITVIKNTQLVWRCTKRFSYPNTLKAVLYVVSRKWLKASQLSCLYILRSHSQILAEHKEKPRSADPTCQEHPFTKHEQTWLCKNKNPFEKSFHSYNRELKIIFFIQRFQFV